MATFILTWNPERWDQDESSYAKDLKAFERGGLLDGRWSIGNRTGGVEVGDRAFLLRQHQERGIIGSGEFISGWYSDRHWDPQRAAAGEEANYADVRFDVLLPVKDRVPVEDLTQLIPQYRWRPQSSGEQFPDALCASLEQAWERHLLGLGMFVSGTPGEVHRADFAEGAVQRVPMNRYERDPRARAACIAHHGTTCSACGFDFEATYGELGRGYIHVHHVKDLSTLGKRYRVDPVKDLKPLCPNCHAMVHRERPALTITELQVRLSGSH